jgi:hypothetical protein
MHFSLHLPTQRNPESAKFVFAQRCTRTPTFLLFFQQNESGDVLRPDELAVETSLRRPCARKREKRKIIRVCFTTARVFPAARSNNISAGGTQKLAASTPYALISPRKTFSNVTPTDRGKLSRIQ